MNLVRKSGSAFLWLNQFLWLKLPEKIRRGRFGLTWGRFIFSLVGMRGGRIQLTTTYFFRNRAELRLLADIAERMENNLSVTVVGCSEGAEVFSIFYTIRKAQPDLKVNILAFDISEPVLEIAREGIFLRSSKLFKYINATETDELFDQAGESLKIKKAFMEGIHWRHDDPTREPVKSSLPKQDIVFINRLLFHMSTTEADRCLRAAALLVRPGGYLFVSGVDLDLKSRIAQESGWQPVTNHIEDIHAGDETMLMDWPLERWGLEPLDRQRNDWTLRYCSVFKIL